MKTTFAILVIAAAVLSGCQTMAGRTATATKTVCAPARPITFSGTRDTARTVLQIRRHNQTYRKLGCF